MTILLSPQALPVRLLLAIGAALWVAAWAVACGGSASPVTVATATAPPAITPPAELVIERGQQACFIRQFPAGNIPSSVKGYRLTAATPLPEGIMPVVKTVRFAGGGANRVLEAELCFTAEAAATAGRVDAQLELRLFNADSEKLSANERLQAVRVLPFSQVLQVR